MADAESNTVKGTVLAKEVFIKVRVGRKGKKKIIFNFFFSPLQSFLRHTFARAPSIIDPARAHAFKRRASMSLEC